jgi:hypothetical protein
MKAKEDDILSGDAWSNPSTRKVLIKRVHDFLIRQIV